MKRFGQKLRRKCCVSDLLRKERKKSIGIFTEFVEAMSARLAVGKRRGRLGEADLRMLRKMFLVNS